MGEEQLHELTGSSPQFGLSWEFPCSAGVEVPSVTHIPLCKHWCKWKTQMNSHAGNPCGI